MPKLISLKKSTCLWLLGVAKAYQNLVELGIYRGEGRPWCVRVLPYIWRHRIA